MFLRLFMISLGVVVVLGDLEKMIYMGASEDECIFWALLSDFLYV